MRTRLKLFLEWGIVFGKPYEIMEKSARKVDYADDSPWRKKLSGLKPSVRKCRKSMRQLRLHQEELRILWHPSISIHLFKSRNPQSGDAMGYFTSLYSSELPHRARTVYMYLSDRSDKEGRCYPAIGTIARKLKLSRSTVKRAIVDLEKNGYLTKEQRWRESGGKSSNMFYLKKADTR